MPAVEKYEDFDDKESFILYKLGFLLSSGTLNVFFFFCFCFFFFLLKLKIFITIEVYICIIL